MIYVVLLGGLLTMLAGVDMVPGSPGTLVVGALVTVLSLPFVAVKMARRRKRKS